MDAHKNFAYSTVATAPTPAGSGLTLSVQVGHGARFPAAPFNVTVWPAGLIPLPNNATILRITGIVGDERTFLRSQEGTSNRDILAGDQIAATITVKTLEDIEGALAGTTGPTGATGPTGPNGATGTGIT